MNLRNGSVILETISEIRSNDTLDDVKKNFLEKLEKFNCTDKLGCFDILSFKVKDFDPKKEPEKLKGYEISWIVIGCIFGACFIFLIGFMVVKYLRKDDSNYISYRYN
jgi:hypothetical protein